MPVSLSGIAKTSADISLRSTELRWAKRCFSFTIRQVVFHQVVAGQRSLQRLVWRDCQQSEVNFIFFQKLQELFAGTVDDFHRVDGGKGLFKRFDQRNKPEAANDWDNANSEGAVVRHVIFFHRKQKCFVFFCNAACILNKFFSCGGQQNRSFQQSKG